MKRSDIIHALIMRGYKVNYDYVTKMWFIRKNDKITDESRSLHELYRKHKNEEVIDFYKPKRHAKL